MPVSCLTKISGVLNLVYHNQQRKYSSIFRENRCPPPPKPVYSGKFSHEAVTLKIKSRSPKSNKLLILSNLYRLANLVNSPSNGSWDNMQTNTFWLNFGGLCLAVTWKIRSRSPKPIQLFIMSKCYIHANLVKICQLVHEILCTQAPFGSNLAVEVPQWPWKIGQGHQHQISSSSCPNVISMQMWLKSANQFMRYGAHKPFLA